MKNSLSIIFCLFPANLHGILLIMFTRLIETTLPKKSFFLFGPRQVGKSTLLSKIQSTLSVDLLDTETQLNYSKDPKLLLRQIEGLVQKKGPIFIDEIQKVPKLLDLIHSLMEKYPELQFIMCGSSARKLRHGAANLLGGRALYRTLHPLTMQELKNHFHLDLILHYGSLPKIYTHLLQKEEILAQDLLRAYVITYLKEEVKAESLVRNLEGFQNFLDLVANQFAEQVNFLDVGRNCSVAYSTVREYYSILEDTLIGRILYPYLKSFRKRMSHSPKFYFFDNGVTRALLGSIRTAPPLIEKGRLFEQWFFQELYRYNEYHQKDWKIFFWRTSHGAEVDFVIEQGRSILCAIECKYKKSISGTDFTGIRSFLEVYPKTPTFLVAPIEIPQKMDHTMVLSPEKMLKELEKY